MQKCYCHFFITEHACYLPALPFLQSEFGWKFKANSASLTPYCGVSRGRTSAHCTLFSRWSTLSNSRLSSHSLFPGKLGRLMTSIPESKDGRGSP